jgi:hypothetical protein
MWRRPNGDLPNDMKFIRSLLPAMHGLTFNRLIPPLLKRFFTLGQDGNFTQKRLEKELRKSKEISEKQRRNVGERWSRTKENKDLACTNVIPSQLQSQRKKDTEATLPPAKPAQPPDPSIAERELFDRGKSVLGQNSGGLIVELKRSKGGNTALARAVIEEASTKQNPREYVSGAIKGNSHGKNNGSSSVAIARELAAYYREEEAALGNVRNLRSG